MPIGISKLCNEMKESATLAVSAKAKALESQGKHVINFGIGEPDFETPEFIRKATDYAVNHGYTKYTLVGGLNELKDAIIQKFQKDNGLTYARNEIMVSCGAKHSIYNALRAILNPGDEVILPVPCWVSYPEMIELCGGKPVLVHGEEHNHFLPTVAQIQKAVTSKTKAILINSPSNPLGCIWSEELLKGVAELAVKEQFYIISDEIYGKLIYDNNKHISIASFSDDVKKISIVINGVSKAYAMTGYRIGYAAGPSDVISAMTKFQSQTTSSTAAMTQYAAKVALESDDSCCAEMKHAFEERRNILTEQINAIDGISCQVPHGAFYIMINVKGVIGKRLKGKKIENDTDFALMLLENNLVALVPGEPFFAPGYCRISYALDINESVEGIKRIKDFVSELE